MKILHIVIFLSFAIAMPSLCMNTCVLPDTACPFLDTAIDEQWQEGIQRRTVFFHIAITPANALLRIVSRGQRVISSAQTSFNPQKIFYPDLQYVAVQHLSAPMILNAKMMYPPTCYFQSRTVEPSVPPPRLT